MLMGALSAPKEQWAIPKSCLQGGLNKLDVSTDQFVDIANILPILEPIKGDCWHEKGTISRRLTKSLEKIGLAKGQLLSICTSYTAILSHLASGFLYRDH
jgi:hypothetical protein